MYLDTCIEPWPGGYTDPNLSPSLRSNYALREAALTLRKKLGAGPTAVLTHGANPGLVSHFVKQALLNIAKDTGVDAGNPKAREEWAALGHKLGVKVMHVAERDTLWGGTVGISSQSQGCDTLVGHRRAWTSAPSGVRARGGSRLRWRVYHES